MTDLTLGEAAQAIGPRLGGRPRGDAQAVRAQAVEEVLAQHREPLRRDDDLGAPAAVLGRRSARELAPAALALLASTDRVRPGPA